MTKKTEKKQMLVALLLSIFAGTLGLHHFYVGKTKTGAIMLLLTLSFVGMLITSVWALIDIINIALGKFTDSEGRELI